MDIKVVWILSNYPFCRRTEGGLEQREDVRRGNHRYRQHSPDIVYEYSPCSILMKILLNCDEDFTQFYYGFYSILLFIQTELL